ncbi:hypothetical protein ACFFJY_09025 [Fictibacillus aquaticus]|uniref:Uncharacterized protein n=1 Tax=Fictibacillus aquaticus TaxID=2021314 RepID=A0A235FCA7_9BACL|nr:hypothetical protein [Fictibacillus aquaticus]OYD58425.1 hypothetical protein CGZ90_00540 [Fictibacillus aquaticus]
MMNKDQAGSLRELAEETGSAVPASATTPLPPRREFHQRKRREETMENSKAGEQDEAPERKPFPLFKVILLAFLLLIAATFSYDYWSGRILDPLDKNKNDEPVQVQIEK